MTAAEFKELKPEYKNIEGDQLWNAMEDYMLRQQRGSEVLKVIMPIWKTHTLRWLFYRKVIGSFISNPKYDKWSSGNRCVLCKKGVNLMIMFSEISEGGTKKHLVYCPHCGEEYKKEPNTNLSHNLWKFGKWINMSFWLILDKLHLIRSGSRYGLFGDEARYVKLQTIYLETGKTTQCLEKRKWWEYILIEKPIHNF